MKTLENALLASAPFPTVNRQPALSSLKPHSFYKLYVPPHKYSPMRSLGEIARLGYTVLQHQAFAPKSSLRQKHGWSCSCNQFGLCRLPCLVTHTSAGGLYTMLTNYPVHTVSY